ncbi:N6-threonylcarbamoyl adenosine t(6)A37 modification in tRNA [Helicobacter baculiformis]|uniref:N6-threonylcarbamoyl adenosine t(6)A37 modification in tRNA n=1 Tax=Helicobacter baculiformis TaxID=427351 RepID=A0ABV7ZKJ2_9HELI|nr:N6-threonylcarbamoyl adenosine t(6)A37 modification in tRNA [Helicobacter baculiformis]
MRDLITSALFLAQSDTTAGFFGTDSNALNRTKNSPPHKPLLQVVASLRALPVRVPQIHRHFVRHKRGSFIYPTMPPRGYRVIRDPRVLGFVIFFDVLYSTSANPSGANFNLEWARENASITLEDRHGLYQAPPSAIFKLSRTRKKRLR